MVVGFAPGGPADVMARLVGQRMTAALGKTMVVDNRPGAGGTIAARMVSESEPDGYTLLLGNTSTLVISPLIYRSIGYDPIKGFAPIARLGTTSNILIANPRFAPNFRGRADRLCQGTSRRAQLFVGRYRHATASHRRNVQVARRPRHNPRALQGRRPLHCGSDRRG